MDQINQNSCGSNSSNTNKRKFEDEISEIREAKHACLCLERGSTESLIQSSDVSMSAKDSNSFLEDVDSVMSVSDDSRKHLEVPHSISSSSSCSVNWIGEKKTCDETSAYNLYACPSFEDWEFSSSEYDGTKQAEASMEDFCCSSEVVSYDSVLSSGRWDVNQDNEQGIEKLTIDKEFEQYFSMLML